MQTTSEYVTIAEAAERLGISKSAVRRRLHSGQLTGRQEERPQGHIWLIALPADAPAGHANGGAHHPTNGAAPADTSRHVPREVPAGAAGPGTALTRAAEMAIYSEQLLRPYVEKIEAQATQIGRLETEVEHLRAQLAGAAPASGQAEPPPTHDAPQAAPWPEGRPWWQRLLWG